MSRWVIGIVMVLAEGFPAWLVVIADPTPSVQPQIPVDRHGDALPTGAVARLGTIRFRGLLSRGVGDSLATLRDNRVVLIDPTSGDEIRRLPGPDPLSLEVSSFVLSDDARYIA